MTADSRKRSQGLTRREFMTKVGVAGVTAGMASALAALPAEAEQKREEHYRQKVAWGKKYPKEIFGGLMK